mmetsp:Transcript_78713/g.227578  ORF Transcript_78713/g.227578 Transcript_78713/m.227578 type:complete len:689 (-) Transcript_78713:216-2282(-)
MTGKRGGGGKAGGKGRSDWYGPGWEGEGYAGWGEEEWYEWNTYGAKGEGNGGGGGGGRGGSGGGSQNGSALEELMRRKGIDQAWDALEDMQNQGVFIDRFTISRMLMKTVGDGGARWHPQKVYRGISLVERFIQLEPEEADEVLFNALLDTCCRMKDLDRLESTMLKMRELQIYPSHVTLGILVKAYGQAGDITKVLKVWDEMDEQRTQANAVTFGCMIDACVKCGHVNKAVEIFEDMKAKKKHRNTILYTTLIKGYGMEKDAKHALELFREMREEGVPYNTITYNSIIDVCIKCSELETAEDLLREMISSNENVEPDLITYSTVLKGYCHAGDLDKALQVAETIKACGLKCDELVYNTLMDGCVKANDLSAGIGLFAEMTQSGMQPSLITHSILVRLYQRNGYKGDAYDAVAQLYLHHGIERPHGVPERGGSKSSRSKAKSGGGDKNKMAPLKPGQVSMKERGSGREGGRGSGSSGDGGGRGGPPPSGAPDPSRRMAPPYMDPEYDLRGGYGGYPSPGPPVLGTNVPYGPPPPYPYGPPMPPMGRGYPPPMVGYPYDYPPYGPGGEMLPGYYDRRPSYGGRFYDGMEDYPPPYGGRLPYGGYGPRPMPGGPPIQGPPPYGDGRRPSSASMPPPHLGYPDPMVEYGPTPPPGRFYPGHPPGPGVYDNYDRPMPYEDYGGKGGRWGGGF